MDEWLRLLNIPYDQREHLRKTKRCACGQSRTHLGMFQVNSASGATVTQAMWLCAEHAGQVDWGVQVIEIPAEDNMKTSIRTRIEAAELDDPTYATARRLLQYANAQGLLRLGEWTLCQICGEEPEEFRRQLQQLAENGLLAWMEGNPMHIRFVLGEATPAGSGPAGV